jgi:hypothetical protein
VQLYQRIWRRVSVAIVFVAGAVLVSGAVIRKPIVAGVLLALGTLVVAIVHRRQAPVMSLPTEARIVFGLVSAAVTVVGLLPLIGRTAFLVVVCQVLLGLPLLLWSQTRGVAVPVGASTHELTTAELCEAWRASSAALAFTRNAPGAQSRIVAARSSYLDELCRRHPHEVARWLADGGPDADPADFVSRRPH